MKVLFAVNNESISESIIKKYQQEYKEIISAKNVYYFNAIIKELQRDKTYERIIISEDLQPFSNNNYDAIDKFIFEKMDNISDEATNESGNDIPIILICTDRREKSDPLLVKLFGIGVYNALLGKDRSITQVCELLERPRTKKEAKVYYRIDSEDVDYKVENEGDVSETEIQNILNHYKKINGNEEKYVESFDHIASQYTNNQLRLIAKFLPLNVKAVLEANSAKYQEVVSFGSPTASNNKDYKTSNLSSKNVKFTKQKDNTSNIELIEKNLSQNKMKQPVIIPSAINTSNVRKIEENLPNENNNSNKILPEQVQEIDDILDSLSMEDTENSIPKAETPQNLEEQNVELKRRGRPKKVVTEEDTTYSEKPKKGRGRPKKILEPVVEPVQEIEQPQEEDISNSNSSPVNLFELGDEDTSINSSQNSSSNDMFLPGLDDESLSENLTEESIEEEQISQNNNDNVEDNDSIFSPLNEQNIYEPIENNNQEKYIQNSIENTNTYQNTDLNGLLSQDKKFVAFVGTSKNGTSFLVNNIAEILSQKGINTAILDLTKNKNAYYIYTENEENLRKIAYSCIENLKQGNATGIEVHKNLTVYTTLPGEEEQLTDYNSILQTLMKNYSLVILDCDFETDYNYFNEAQELYLVQSLDVLTIQPLTAFLRDLKAKNVLRPEKIRVVLNKLVKLRNISEKTIIGGMAYYNDPAMSFMTELFNKDNVQYTVVPFEEQAYSKYLEGLINCKITLNDYSKNFMLALNKLGDMVYPLINNKNSKNKYNNYQNNFSNDMNNTLNKMKNNY